MQTLTNSKFNRQMRFLLPLIKCLVTPPSFPTMLSELCTTIWFDYRTLGSNQKLGDMLLLTSPFSNQANSILIALFLWLNSKPNIWVIKVVGLKQQGFLKQGTVVPYLTNTISTQTPSRINWVFLQLNYPPEESPSINYSPLPTLL